MKGFHFSSLSSELLQSTLVEDVSFYSVWQGSLNCELLTALRWCWSFTATPQLVILKTEPCLAVCSQLKIQDGASNISYSSSVLSTNVKVLLQYNFFFLSFFLSFFIHAPSGHNVTTGSVAFRCAQLHMYMYMLVSLQY